MLGNFDGMHMGHLALYAALEEVAQAQGLEKVVLSFDPHPMIYKGVTGFGLLLSGGEKARILRELGADAFIEYPFDHNLRNTPPEEFIMSVVASRLGAKVVVVGDDYRFGKDRSGSAAQIQKLGAVHGFDVRIAEPVMYGGERVCSSLVRACVLAHDMPKCYALMTRPYQISGVVEHGRKLGRRLGFPTINISPPREKVLPPYGVYLTSATILSPEGQHSYEGITNIGTNPTVSEGETAVKCETFLYDFNEKVYGREAVISFYQNIRGERKFPDEHVMTRQVNIDIETGRELWKKLELL